MPPGRWFWYLPGRGFSVSLKTWDSTTVLIYTLYVFHWGLVAFDCVLFVFPMHCGLNPLNTYMCVSVNTKTCDLVTYMNYISHCGFYKENFNFTKESHSPSRHLLTKNKSYTFCWQFFGPSWTDLTDKGTPGMPSKKIMQNCTWISCIKYKEELYTFQFNTSLGIKIIKQDFSHNFAFPRMPLKILVFPLALGKLADVRNPLGILNAS